jgi:hypothetical protein
MKHVILLVLISIASINCNEDFNKEQEWAEAFMDLNPEEAAQKFILFLGGGKDKDDDKESVSDKMSDAVGSLTEPIGKAIKALKSSKSNEIKETLLGKGFKEFVSSASVKVAKGIKAEFFDKYLTFIEKTIKVPDARKEEVKDILEQSQYVESNLWSAYDTVFSVGTGGDVKYVSLMITRDDEKGVYHCVCSDVQATFKLAPDVMIINKKLSIIGGLWEEDNWIEKEIPKGYTQEDMETVINFFSVVAFKAMANQFGIDFGLPESV